MWRYFLDDQLNALPEIDMLKRSDVVIVVDELLMNLNRSTTKADMWVINNTKGFHEVGKLIENNSIQVKESSDDWLIWSGKICSRLHWLLRWMSHCHTWKKQQDGHSGVSSNIPTYRSIASETESNISFHYCGILCPWVYWLPLLPPHQTNKRK